MPSIKQLPPHVADLIAAGEVVERPSSVMKELLENAIDAGATSIVAEIAAGGRSLIRVTDNGSGIAPEELKTAFLRHATSKLRKPEDLPAIGTLGFRGEALAAIAAVSRIEILSRQRGADMGAALSLEGGTPGEVEPAGCPEGTAIIVRNLFFNTPARQKFLKSDSAEAAAVATAVGQIALGSPGVSVRYIRDGKEEFHTPGDGSLLSAIYTVRGRDFAKSLREVSGDNGTICVRGYVTEPLAGRGSRSMQTFFCCGRLIKSPLLSAALEEAYANRQMKGKFPGCVLCIDLPLGDVDVNVHPAKTVVKFADESAVFSTVHHVVRDALDSGTGQPEVGKSAVKSVSRSMSPRGDFYQSMDAKTFREQQAGKGRKSSPAVSGVGYKAEHTAGYVPGAEQEARLPAGYTPGMGNMVTLRDRETPRFNGEPIGVDVFDADPKGKSEGNEKFSTQNNPFVEKSFLEISCPALEEGETKGKPVLPDKYVEDCPDKSSGSVQETFLEEAPVPWRLAGELFKTYIVAEDGEDVVLIDKHAAHERIRFDRLKAQDQPVMRQTLLTSLVVTLEQEQQAVLLENLSLLEEFGFEAEDFGAGKLVVRSIPADLDVSLAGETLEELAQTMLAHASADPSSARDALYHAMACKAAIKGGWDSDPSELKILIDAVQSGSIQFCPHGRPVAVRLRKRDLEKMFKRV